MVVDSLVEPRRQTVPPRRLPTFLASRQTLPSRLAAQIKGACKDTCVWVLSADIYMNTSVNLRFVSEFLKFSNEFNELVLRAGDFSEISTIFIDHKKNLVSIRHLTLPKYKMGQ